MSDFSRARAWVVVTGAASGIGKAVALRLLSDGYLVLALDRHAEGLEELQDASQEQNERLSTFVADLADPAVGDDTAARLQAEEGRLFAHQERPCLMGIVNVAGISTGNSIDKITDEDWELSMAVNATGPMRLIRALQPFLSTDPGASIVNIASPVAIVGARKVSYSASKGALLGLNAALTQNLSPQGIRVNAILPGPTITAMTRDWSDEKRAMIASGSPLNRLCRPEDIAGPVSFLLSQDAAYITGTVLNVTGGSVMGV